MKRFWAFSYDTYYPSGGIGDRVGMFDTIEEARSALLAENGDFREIVDVETGEIIETVRSS